MNFDGGRRSPGVSDHRRFVGGSVALGGLALGHAALTWPSRATVAFFCGGAAIAVLAEAVAINAGWELLIVLAGAVVAGGRLRGSETTAPERPMQPAGEDD